MNDDKGTVLLAKLVALFALVGISSWSEAASFFTAILTASMTVRFYWRNVWRPLLEDKGFLKRKRRRKTDRKDNDDDSESGAP